jgi:predicted phage baseplate assembly protein
VEADGTAYLRFGDARHGARPAQDTAFTASYRVGVGVAGNVGAGAIAHILGGPSGITSVRNPMPAAGGVDPESMEDVRQRAPSAFRTQERAVTEADYAEVIQRHGGVQRAAATFRWTGSWHTVFLTPDRLGGGPVDGPFRDDLRRFVERFRMAGHDLEVDAPRFVALEVAMDVCVKPAYFRGEVKAALLDVFSNRILPDGRLGVFHPDNFSFGQTVYLSRLIAAAQAVDGVDSVDVKLFRRLGVSDPRPLAAGELRLNRLEIARLDNDPSFPERGVFRLDMRGGK